MKIWNEAKADSWEYRSGHGFSFSKVEFTAGFERMRGRRVLWPQGYHCTGLPIKVCADKLANEVKMFGQEFENYTEEEEVVLQPGAAAPVQGEDVTKFKAQKGKLASKTVRAKYQFQIMLSMGIPRQEIHRFSDVSCIAAAPIYHPWFGFTCKDG